MKYKAKKAGKIEIHTNPKPEIHFEKQNKCALFKIYIRLKFMGTTSQKHRLTSKIHPHETRKVSSYLLNFAFPSLFVLTYGQ